MKTYSFKYEKVDDIGHSIFTIQAESEEEAVRMATLINPNATLVGGV